MDTPMEKKTPLSDMMRTTMDKIHEMVDANTIVGQPITTPDGVTLIPISKVSFGFGSGGGDYGKTSAKNGVYYHHSDFEVMVLANACQAVFSGVGSTACSV